MVIEFRCPNGHRLNCPDERAGLPGKCPKCKATFRVPAPGASDTKKPDPPDSDSAVSEPEISDTPSAAEGSAPTAQTAAAPNPAEVASADEPTASQPSTSGARIIFLCPKGHKLNCPASMQGRPGKCPHCGAMFLVPEQETEEDGDEEDESSDSLPELEDDGESSEGEVAEQESGEQEIISFNGDAFEADPFAFDFSSLTAETPGSNAMAGLFQRLWLHKQTGGIVELYLKGGEVIAPEWFSPSQSQEACGMFAFAERDGSFTLTAVQWDAIERIAVRGVNSLPEGMFDEET